MTMMAIAILADPLNSRPVASRAIAMLLDVGRLSVGMARNVLMSIVVYVLSTT